MSLGKAKEWIFDLWGYPKTQSSAWFTNRTKGVDRSRGIQSTLAQIAEAADAYCRLAETPLGLTEAIDFAIRHVYPSAGTLSIYDPIEAARNPRKATEIYLGQRTM